MIHRHKLGRSWLIGPALVALAVLLTVICGCTLSRWEAEDGHSKVNHGLTIRFGTVFYIGDDRGGYTEADWSAAGEGSKATTQSVTIVLPAEE
jgi:hypothetical protein